MQNKLLINVATSILNALYGIERIAAMWAYMQSCIGPGPGRDEACSSAHVYCHLIASEFVRQVGGASASSQFLFL